MNDRKMNDESQRYQPSEHRDVIVHKSMRNVDFFHQAPEVIALFENTERIAYSPRQ
jgi:hypothetical protein